MFRHSFALLHNTILMNIGRINNCYGLKKHIPMFLTALYSQYCKELSKNVLCMCFLAVLNRAMLNIYFLIFCPVNTTLNLIVYNINYSILSEKKMAIIVYLCKSRTAETGGGGLRMEITVRRYWAAWLSNRAKFLLVFNTF